MILLLQSDKGKLELEVVFILCRGVLRQPEGDCGQHETYILGDVGESIVLITSFIFGYDILEHEK